MTELDSVQKTSLPLSRQSIGDDLRALGIQPGMSLLVHSSLSAIGWVAGGAPAVVLALEDVLTSAGTLVMPTFSSQLSEPSAWGDPPVPPEWYEPIRQQMTAFRSDLTPTRGMGAIVESFRSQQGVLRSNHPVDSFAAWGANKQTVLGTQELAYGLADHSPLGRLYDLNGYTLLLGVTYQNCTSLHLAEHRASWPGKSTIMRGSPVLIDNKDTWVTYEDWLEETDDFETVGASFERDSSAWQMGKIGNADARLIHIPSLVDYAIQWMNNNRQ